MFCVKGSIKDKRTKLKESISLSLLLSLSKHKLLEIPPVPFLASQFARIHKSSLINFEKILNRSITKFYNSGDVNVVAAELRLTKMRPSSFYEKHNVTAYLSGYTGRICLRLNLYFQHIKKLLQSKKR